MVSNVVSGYRAAMNATRWAAGTVGAPLILALLILQAIDIVGSGLMEPHEAEHAAAMAVPEGQAPAAAPKAPAGPGPILAMLATADVAKGEKISKKCHACHTLDKGGPNKIGPNLWGVVGRARAAHEGFSYSSAMHDLGGHWDYQTLNKFIYKPRDFVPGTKMTFAGLKKDADRADLIAYLRTLSDNPAPLPK